jgi:hypothetical protein
VARQPSEKDAPAELEPELDELDDDAVDDEVDELDEDEPDDDVADEDEVVAPVNERTSKADAFWTKVRVEPVEIALPKGVGYTLRAYRMSNELTPPEIEEEEDAFAVLERRDDDELPEEIEISDEEIFESVEEDEPTDSKTRSKTDSDDESEDDEDEEKDHGLTDEEIEEVLAKEAEEEAAKEPEPEEVPVFLGSHGRLFLFRSAEGLVAFVQSDEEHELQQLDTWNDLKNQITVNDVVPSDDNRYELDLVVENLRGGHDAWDADLLLAAGEAARDVAYALRLKAVQTALMAGSPLDDLDEALRADANGGVGGFFARRRLKKIGAQQAALGWRTIIGKISAAVDWRD